MLKMILSELREIISHLEGAGYFDQKPKPDDCPPLVAVGLKRRRTGYETKVREKGKKLTKKDALDIFREDRFSRSELAEIYDVTPSTIDQIKSGHTWWKATGMPKKPRNNGA